MGEIEWQLREGDWLVDMLNEPAPCHCGPRATTATTSECERSDECYENWLIAHSKSVDPTTAHQEGDAS